MANKRHPFLSLVLGFVPGLGQMYNGQLRKGILFAIGNLAIAIIGFSILAAFHKNVFILRLLNVRRNQPKAINYYAKGIKL